MAEVNEQTEAKLKKTAESKKNKKKKPKKPRVRLFPLWLRLIVIIILLSLSLLIGVIVGHSVIGEDKPWDVFKKETWQHIIDIVVKE